MVARLKDELAALRKRVGDTGEDYPEVEAIVQEFWNYDEADRKKAIEISNEYLQSRQKPKTSKASPVRRAKGDWILPAGSTAPLRTCKGVKEISRDAVYKIAGGAPNAYNVDNAHLLSGTHQAFRRLRHPRRKPAGLTLHQ